jgi:glycosyltransferase involved in cell wall biosynthesis
MRVFFVHTGNETFTKIDRDLLSETFEVEDFHAAQKFPAEFLRYWRGVKQCDVVFCWFASWNSLWAIIFARLMGEKSILVVGGYDLANLPEANYGHQRGGLSKWTSRLAMNLADRLFTNSYYSQTEAQKNAGIPPERIQVIYHGVPDPFGEMPQIKKERIALTVGNVEFPNLNRKGLEPFVQAAAYLPDVQFIIVGKWADGAINYLKSIASPNVVFTGRVSAEELLDHYRRAAVYVQASLHEGFGLSVAEAMLAGCIPVVTRAGSLPEVVGECGIFSNSPEPPEIAKSIKTALNSSPTARGQARERILLQFPMEKRKQSLKQLVYFILSKKNAKR